MAVNLKTPLAAPLTAEAVAFVIGHQKPHGHIVLAHGSHHLFGFGVGHARVVFALHHKQWFLDRAGIVQG